MKTLLLFALTLLVSTAKAQGMGDPSPYSPDQPFYNYSGDMARGGVLVSTRQSDAVWGTADCYSGPFLVDYPNGWFIGGRVTVRNMYPATCGALSYSMNSSQISQRLDGIPDHIKQTGVAWWIPVYPAIYQAYEACNLIGLDDGVGSPYVIVNSLAGCGSSVF